jgi:predicted nucleic acid-binding Zn finger protein
MSVDTSDELDSIETRTRRALEEPLTVLTTDLKPVDEDEDTSIVTVTSHSGSEYTVDVREGVCTCPDHQRRNATCKHLRRARVALAHDSVDSDTLARLDIDAGLGANAPGPVVATSDGGIVNAGDDAEILAGDDDGRPDDCDCWDADAELPCWPCYRDGFDVPNPSAGEV